MKAFILLTIGAVFAYLGLTRKASEVWANQTQTNPPTIPHVGMGP